MAAMKMTGVTTMTEAFELNGLRPMERNRAIEENLGVFREILDEVNQLLARAGDHRGRLRLVTLCAIIGAVLRASDDGGCRRILYSFVRALTLLSDLAAEGHGAIKFDATKREVSCALMSKLTENSSEGAWVGTPEAWLKMAAFIGTYRDDLLGKVDLGGLLKLDIPLREALPEEPGLAPIVDQVVEDPHSVVASEQYAAAAMNLRCVANSVTDANTIVSGCGGSDGAVGRSNPVLCRAEVLRWVLDESVSNTEQEPDGLPGAAASMAIAALIARSEAGATVVMVKPFNAGLRFIAREGDLDAAEIPTGSIWIGDFEAWRRVADFALSKLRMGVEAGILARALAEGPASALTGGSLLSRK
jgi:hypothetical protein